MDREEILSKVTKWSNQMGLAVKGIEDPTVDFRFAISEHGLPAIEIVHEEVESTHVLFAASVLVSEEDQRKMLKMTLKELEELLWNIRLKLLSMNVEFRMLRPAGGIPTVWEIHSKLFLEGAIAQHFSDIYLKVKNAVLYVMWSYRRALDTLKSGA